MLADEICIDEQINVRQYLEFVSIKDVGNTELLNLITYLLVKYDYDWPIIEFSTGQIIYPKMNTKKKII